MIVQWASLAVREAARGAQIETIADAQDHRKRLSPEGDLEHRGDPDREPVDGQRLPQACQTNGPVATTA